MAYMYPATTSPAVVTVIAVGLDTKLEKLEFRFLSMGLGELVGVSVVVREGIEVEDPSKKPLSSTS